MSLKEQSTNLDREVQRSRDRWVPNYVRWLLPLLIALLVAATIGCAWLAYDNGKQKDAARSALAQVGALTVERQQLLDELKHGQTPVESAATVARLQELERQTKALAEKGGTPDAAVPLLPGRDGRDGKDGIGVKGDTGAAGVNGRDGLSVKGDKGDSVKGDPGPKGDKGDPGVDAPTTTTVPTTTTTTTAPPTTTTTSTTTSTTVTTTTITLP